MKPCLETIRVQNQRLQNLSSHNERFNRTRWEIFGCTEFLNLATAIHLPEMQNDIVYKCRIIYDISILSITFQPYQIKPVQSLQLVHDDGIDYSYKWLDRACLNEHVQASAADDVLIVKNGFLTDTSYANIAFFDGQHWLTSSTPLLAGTRRQSLIAAGIIHEELLKPSDLKYFRSAKLLNAMLDWDESSSILIKNIR